MVSTCLLLKRFVFRTVRGEHKTRVTGDEAQETVIPTMLRKRYTMDILTIFRFVFGTAGISYSHFTFIVTTQMYSHHRQRSTGQSRNTLPVKKNEKESKARNKTINTANTKIRQKRITRHEKLSSTRSVNCFVEGVI